MTPYAESLQHLQIFFKVHLEMSTYTISAHACLLVRLVHDVRYRFAEIRTTRQRLRSAPHGIVMATCMCIARLADCLNHVVLVDCSESSVQRQDQMHLTIR